MKRNTFFVLLTMLVLLFNPGTPLLSDSIPDENDSNMFAARLCYELLENPSAVFIPFYTSKLMELAPSVGRTKICTAFQEAIKKLRDSGENSGIAMQSLRLSIDELNGGWSEAEKNFLILKRWNISGPWKKYGKPDIDYPFNPEKVFKIGDIEKGKNVPAGEDGVLYPYKFHHQADETYYAASSFTAASGVVLWIISDSGYKLIVNGKEIFYNNAEGIKTVRAFALAGARGYTVMLKMQCGSEDSHPYIRGMVTDEKHLPLQLSSTGAIYNFNFTAEKIYSSDEAGETLPHEAFILTERMIELINSGNYADGYRLGKSVIEKYPSYSVAYNTFIPLLDLMNRDDEFLLHVNKFRKIFPDSDIHHKWLCEFYMTRDWDKFTDIMKTIPLWQISQRAAETYLYLLCGKKKYSEALALCYSHKSIPLFSSIIPDVIRESGDITLWRKSLLEGIALRGDADLYYALGLAEMQSGLDPVMYWERGIPLEQNHGFMADLSGIYENGILEMNDFYKGEFTDFHPEFKWSAKQRRVVIHVYPSGMIALEGTDIIPPGKKLVKDKNSGQMDKFSSGEMYAQIPYVKGVKVLYVMTAKESLASKASFKTELRDKKSIAVKYQCSGDEEFSVIKYSGEIEKPEDIFNLTEKLILKAENEKISSLEYEVICHDDSAPHIIYRGNVLSSGRFSGGVVKSGITEKFSSDDNEAVAAEISMFPSDLAFARWYGNIIAYALKTFTGGNLEVSPGMDTKSSLMKIHLYVMSSISKTGGVNLNPSKAESVLIRKEGTVEERTLLAKAILEDRGIKSFISFSKNRNGLIDKILLYVPVDRDRGYWLDFYGEGVSDKMESGSKAIIITGEGYQTFPVTPETCIR